MSIQWIGRCSTQPQPTSSFSGQFWGATMLDLLPPGMLWYVITTRMMWNICRQVTGNPNLNRHIVGNPYSKVTNEGLVRKKQTPMMASGVAGGGWSKGHPHDRPVQSMMWSSSWDPSSYDIRPLLVCFSNPASPTTRLGHGWSLVYEFHQSSFVRLYHHPSLGSPPFFVDWWQADFQGQGMLFFFQLRIGLVPSKNVHLFFKAGLAGQVRRNAGPFLRPRFIFQVKHLVNSLAPIRPTRSSEICGKIRGILSPQPQ